VGEHGTEKGTSVVSERQREGAGDGEEGRGSLLLKCPAADA
jgi:hypothetical protein